MKFLKSTDNMGITCIESLDEAKDELQEFFENATEKDTMTFSVVEISKEEYENLSEFD